MDKKSGMRSVRFNVFFLRPKTSADATKIARKLASRKGVKEILVTEGKYGFVVKAAEKYSEDILKGISDDYDKVTCCYLYK